MVSSYELDQVDWGPRLHPTKEVNCRMMQREVDLVVLSKSDPSSDWHTRYILDAARSQGLSAELYDPRDLSIVAGPSGKPTLVHLSGYELLPRAIFNRALGDPTEELLVAAEVRGIPTINRFVPSYLATNKIMSLMLFMSQGLRVPMTLFSRPGERVGGSRGLTIFTRHILDLPVITKPLKGSLGISVERQDDLDDLRRYIDHRLGADLPLHVQEYLDHGGSDIRVTTVGDRCVGAVRRVARPGSIATNLGRGGRPVPLDITPELEEVALTAARAVDLDFAGIDLIEDNEGYIVLEANACPNFDNTVLVGEFPVGEGLINFIKGAIRATGRR